MRARDFFCAEEASSAGSPGGTRCFLVGVDTADIEPGDILIEGAGAEPLAEHAEEVVADVELLAEDAEEVPVEEVGVDMQPLAEDADADRADNPRAATDRARSKFS